MQLLTLDEFGNWLRSHDDPAMHRWGDEVLDASEAQANHDTLTEDIDEALDVEEGQTYCDAVQAAARAADKLSDVRQVLIDTGALAADDEETDVADLVRALLS